MMLKAIEELIEKYHKKYQVDILFRFGTLTIKVGTCKGECTSFIRQYQLYVYGSKEQATMILDGLILVFDHMLEQFYTKTTLDKLVQPDQIELHNFFLSTHKIENTHLFYVTFGMDVEVIQTLFYELDSNGIIFIESEHSLFVITQEMENTVELFTSLQSEFLTDVKFGVSQKINHIDDIELAIKQAQKAYGLIGIYHQNQTYYFYGENVLDVLIDTLSLDQYEQMFQQFHGILECNEEEQKTLKLFLENELNITETAKKLYIHRNTLNYRLDKIAQKTKLDPRKLDDAILLRILLIYESIKMHNH